MAVSALCTGTRQSKMVSTSVPGGFGGEGAGSGAEREPLRGALNAAEDAAALGGAEGGVALLGKRGGFGFFVREVALCGGELSSASLAVEREVVEGAEVGGGDDGAGGRAGVLRVRVGGEIPIGTRGSLVVRVFCGVRRRRVRRRPDVWRGQCEGGRKGNRFGESIEDLRRGDDRLFEFGDLREGLRERGVAVFLVGGGFGDGLLRSSELRGELCAVAAVGAPGFDDSDSQEDEDKKFCEA